MCAASGSVCLPCPAEAAPAQLPRGVSVKVVEEGPTTLEQSWGGGGVLEGDEFVPAVVCTAVCACVRVCVYVFGGCAHVCLCATWFLFGW